MTITASDVWEWMPSSTDRAGQPGADSVMGRVAAAVEELWVRDGWPSLIGKTAALTYSDGLVASDNHHFATDTAVSFALLDDGYPLVAGTTYYVRDVTADTFALAATAGGAALTLTSDGTGYVWASPRPSYVDLALIEEAAMYYDARRTPNGVVAGTLEMGPFRLTKFHPHIERMLNPGGWAVA